ncbi:structural maintenance of chromosomes protein 2 [Condylostylus longicornis]|uniref:structural maintenance of chromosomes protein 2 n=1 Tax=Condylostylus longicornis TaxID=2530218 RepID=UPI00244DF8FE|nr:structural maintenance of chromosomes protein 2 [Condylostylus longicornis]
MYIKSVIIDGFKSYGRRTEIHGFDPEFTAITGLNGTGKSNILDAICFVLGISNLSQVRATSLQDLVFKSGQAGVTKATVTLIFDNTDKDQCPLGYEKCLEISVTRQIVVGGKNKYLINGKNVQNKKVADLFCSVQLNVNNPSFLIMQGRITKVLNMKPQETLSMIEEAAGTSMYESKKVETTRLIEKKDVKVRETDTLLKEEVEPRLEKLRTETAAYQEFQKITRDIEYLTRIHISFKYLKCKEALQETEKNIQKIDNHITNCKLKITENQSEIKKCEEIAEIIQHKIDNESGGELAVLEEKLSSKSSQEAKSNGEIKALQANIDQENKKVKALKKSIEDDNDALIKTMSKMEKVKDLFQSLKDADEKDSKIYEESQKKFEALTQGLSTNEEGEASSLQDQLINAKKQVSEAQTAIKTSEMELKHTKQILKQKQSETQVNDAAYLKDKKLLNQIENDLERISADMSKLNYQDGFLENLEEKSDAVSQEIRNLKQQLDRKNAYQYELQYRDPEPNFDRNKVRGMVGKLFKVKDSTNNLALQITSGGMLRNFVTDDDITSKKILEKGQLQHRVVFIPINKITSYVIDPATVQFAQNLVGKQNVESALNLIQYDKRYDPVMKYVFGSTLICKDMNIAKKVTYHKNIMCRTVTLEGDICDPEGTLSGGSRPKGPNLIQEMADIRFIEENLVTKEQELKEIQREMAQVQKLAKFYNNLKRTFELRQHELNACKDRLAQTSFQQHQREIDELTEKSSALENALSTAQEKLKTQSIKAKEIEAKLKDAKGFRERELKAASDALKAAKKQSEESKAKWKKHEEEFETLQLEIQEIKKSKENSEHSLEKMEQNLQKLQDEIATLKSNSKGVENEVADLKSQIKEQKDKINSQNRELRQNLAKKDKMIKQIQEFQLEIKKKENEMTKVKNDNKDGFNKVTDLEKKYGWIVEDRDFFGVKNTRYDYAREDPVEAGKKLQKSKELKEKMERNINLKAIISLQREEEQYKETMRRKKIVEQDKEKIKNIIHKMDEQKKEKIEKAWKEVNTNFSGIFSTLLPGAQAELRATLNNNTITGLEIKVGFNNVWKESLGELSGGQRSLVALSLTLAMLKFSPAPLYILDEVDAALDMSHTQNIGNMFKTYFRDSQFIVVSLKDGMFNNANVLFRTRFEEGVSAVSRTVNKSRK